MSNDRFVRERMAEIKILDQQIWEHRCPPGAVEDFLRALTDTGEAPEFKLDPETAERCGAFLASRLHFLGAVEVRHLLRAVFRHIYVPLCQRGGARSLAQIEAAVHNTRFVALGSPAKSGAHLLYFFRQENRISSRLFSNLSDLFDSGSKNELHLCPEATTVRALVLLDDFSGTGEQAAESLARKKRYLQAFRDGEGRAVHLLLLAATSDALKSLRNSPLLDTVSCLLELDRSYRTFEPESRYFKPSGVSLPFTREQARELFRVVGKKVFPSWPLGRGECQLLLCFHHNTPNNTLPAIWSENSGWTPLFRRYPSTLWR